jgi:3-phosphoshikimate 1-carboxyvinyltransferase
LAIVVARSRTGGRLTGLRTLRVKETDRIAALASELRKIGCTVETGEDWIEITPPPPVPPPPEPEPEARPEALPPMNMHGRAARATVEWRESSSSGGTGVPPVLQGRSADSVIIETYNDHRMAMAFAVLGLAAPGGRRLAIRNPACVRKSYPTFWQDFAKLYR